MLSCRMCHGLGRVMLSLTPAHVLTVDTTVSNGFKPPFDASAGGKVRLYGNATTATTYNAWLWVDKDSTSSAGGITGGTSKLISLDPGANTYTALVLAFGGSAA